MDRDSQHDVDLDELPIDLTDLEVDVGDGDDGIRPPDQGGSGGGGGGPDRDPFLHSRWAAWVPAALILGFGAQSLLVLYVSRMGMGSEGMAWAIAVLFVVSFTVVFILGARFIGRYRR